MGGRHGTAKELSFSGTSRWKWRSGTDVSTPETSDRKDMKENISCREYGIVFTAGAIELVSSSWIPSHSAQGERKHTMREFWVTVAAMVVGYLMYLGLKSMTRK